MLLVALPTCLETSWAAVDMQGRAVEFFSELV